MLTPWTEAEDRRLRDEYGITPLPQLAAAMGRSAIPGGRRITNTTR